MSEERRATDPFVQQLTEIKLSLARMEGYLNKVEDHHKTLYGHDGEPGLTIVVDRLNEVEKSRSAHLAIAWTAIIGLAFERAWSYVTHKGP